MRARSDEKPNVPMRPGRFALVAVLLILLGFFYWTRRQARRLVRIDDVGIAVQNLLRNGSTDPALLKAELEDLAAPELKMIV